MAQPPSMQPNYMKGRRVLVKTKDGCSLPAYHYRNRYYAHGSSRHYNDGCDLTSIIVGYMLWSSWMDSHAGDWNDVPDCSWTEHGATDCSEDSDDSSSGSSCEPESSFDNLGG